jgi:5-(carboxyamino)imidazole ribonucleotide synthase
VGLPAVLKTRRFGYDGKGQAVIRRPTDVDAAWAQMGGVPMILEGFVDFDRELSILAVRHPAGDTAFYPLVENHHEQGILRLSWAPAPALTLELQERAQYYAERILEDLDYVGVLAIELFQAGTGLLANEMAPRVHNSGHWSIEGAETSQFENHVRAVLGLPLGPATMRGHAAMVNLIGGVPDTADVLRHPHAHLHLYGKEPRPGRKVGHITVRHDDPAVVRETVERLRELEGARP